MGDRKNARNFPNATPRNKPVLTSRQTECVNLLIEGWNRGEILRCVQGLAQHQSTNYPNDHKHQFLHLPLNHLGRT